MSIWFQHAVTFVQEGSEYYKNYLLGKEGAVMARSWLALRWRHNNMLMIYTAKGRVLKPGRHLAFPHLTRFSP